MALSKGERVAALGILAVLVAVVAGMWEMHVRRTDRDSPKRQREIVALKLDLLGLQKEESEIIDRELSKLNAFESSSEGQTEAGRAKSKAWLERLGMDVSDPTDRVRLSQIREASKKLKSRIAELE